MLTQRSFPNWAIYDRKYKPSDVPVKQLTHILYAFANINPDDGSVVLTDAWSDEQIRYDGDADVQGKPLYGNLNQFLRLKRENRHLKLLLSIGGWSYSGNFRGMTDGGKRQRFAESAVKLLADYGFDGLDIDWEYPESPREAQAYVDLLRETRAKLDEYAKRVGQDRSSFLLTIAAPCAPGKYEVLNIREMDQYLDFWNLMAYDFSGSWDSAANHQANLHGGELCVEACVRYYKKNGAPPHKLVLGVPLYGRGFDGAQGVGSAYRGTSKGKWEGGVYDYKDLPLQGAEEHLDSKRGAGYSFDKSQGQFITYESPASADVKADFIRKEGLRGAMFWELSGDAPTSSDRSLVRRFADKVCGCAACLILTCSSATWTSRRTTSRTPRAHLTMCAPGTRRASPSAAPRLSAHHRSALAVSWHTRMSTAGPAPPCPHT